MSAMHCRIGTFFQTLKFDYFAPYNFPKNSINLGIENEYVSTFEIQIFGRLYYVNFAKKINKINENFLYCFQRIF